MDTTDELEQVKAERDAAVKDVERLLWLSRICRYCAKSNGKGGNGFLDRTCGAACEPVWRGMKRRQGHG